MFKTISNTLCDILVVNVPDKTFETRSNIAYNGNDEKTLKTYQKTLEVGFRAVAVTNVHKVEELREMDFDTFLANSKVINKYDNTLVCRNIKQWLCDILVVNVSDKTFETRSNIAYNGNDEKTLKTYQKTLEVGFRAVAVTNVHDINVLCGMDFDTFLANSKVVVKENYNKKDNK